MFWSQVIRTANPASSAARMRSPFWTVDHPRPAAVTTSWPVRRRRSPSGAFWSSRMRTRGMPPGVLDDPPRTIRPEALVDLAGDLLRREILGVVDHALGQDARVLDHPLPGHTAGHALYIRALAPIDHG